MNDIDIKYKRDINRSVMIVTSDTYYKGYDERMISENAIPSLLDFTVVNNGGQNSFWYDISEKKSLKGYFLSEGITIVTVKVVFEAILNAIENLSEYLLKEENVLISLDTLFFEKQGFSLKCYLTYVPGANFEFTEAFKGIAEYLVQNVDHENTQNVMACYRVFEKIYEGEFSLLDLIASLEEEKGQEENDYEAEQDMLEDDEAFENDSEDFRGLDYIKDFDEINYSYKVENIEKKKFSIFSVFSKRVKKKKTELFPGVGAYEDFIEEPEDVEYEQEMATTLLNAQGHVASTKKLTYLGNKNIISPFLVSFPFNIGSRNKGNEFIIEEEIISRVHARITKDDGRYFIEDLESKNGTFLNGKMLAVNTPYELFPNDIVDFADISFRFE